MSTLPPPPFPGGPPPVTATAPRDVPLDQPLYGATFTQALNRFFRKYADFSGRASLSEMWWAYLAQLAVMSACYAVFLVATLSLVDPVTGELPDDRVWAAMIPLLLMMAVSLGTLVPMLALMVRRLHDSGRSGWWYLISAVPFVGTIVLLVFLCQASTPTGFAFDRRNSHPSLEIHPILRARHYPAHGYAAPGSTSPGYAGPAGPTDAPTWYPEDRRS